MSVRYFLIQMERGPDTQGKNGPIPTWRPRHIFDLPPGIEKWESMGNARRFMLLRVTGTDAALDALDALAGVVELPDTIGPVRLNRIENALAQRGLVVDFDGVTSGLEAAQRVMAAVQAMVASETPADRQALATLMLSGN